MENAIAALQHSQADKLALTQKSERSIYRGARHRWIPIFYHVTKVCGGKRLLRRGDRLDNNATASEIFSETFELRRHAMAKCLMSVTFVSACGVAFADAGVFRILAFAANFAVIIHTKILRLGVGRLLYLDNNSIAVPLR